MKETKVYSLEVQNRIPKKESKTRPQDPKKTSQKHFGPPWRTKSIFRISLTTANQSRNFSMPCTLAWQRVSADFLFTLLRASCLSCVGEMLSRRLFGVHTHAFHIWQHPCFPGLSWNLSPKTSKHIHLDFIHKSPDNTSKTSRWLPPYPGRDFVSTFRQSNDFQSYVSDPTNSLTFLLIPCRFEL